MIKILRSHLNLKSYLKQFLKIKYPLHVPMIVFSTTRHFGSYQQSKLSVTQHSVVKSNQLSWAGQYKNVNSTISSLL